jgi:hypothetical protein
MKQGCKIIKTVKELKEHMGEFLAYEYDEAYGKKGIWIQKLCKIGNGSKIAHLCTYGYYTAEISPRQRAYTKNPIEPYHTNAQGIIRTPTKEEMNTFRNLWRKYRILGDKNILKH